MSGYDPIMVAYTLALFFPPAWLALPALFILARVGLLRREDFAVRCLFSVGCALCLAPVVAVGHGIAAAPVLWILPGIAEDPSLIKQAFVSWLGCSLLFLLIDLFLHKRVLRRRQRAALDSVARPLPGER